MTKRADRSGPVLLFDGDCALCHAGVRFILRHERRTDLQFAALKSPAGQALRQRCTGGMNSDSVVWVDRSDAVPRCLDQSAALLAVAQYLGGWWTMARLVGIVPSGALDWLYRQLARRRMSLGRSCSHRVDDQLARRLVDDPRLASAGP